MSPKKTEAKRPTQRSEMSKLQWTWKEMKRNWVAYLMIAPFCLIFTLFTMAPVVVSIFMSFTDFNMIQIPNFLFLDNYIRLFLDDDLFLTAIKNTFIFAVIVGPASYLMSLMVAWFINELDPRIRAIVTLIFYAPSIAGNAYSIFSIIFRGDAYGYLNSICLNLGIIDAPMLWLTDPRYIMPVLIFVILWMSMGTGFLSFVAGFQGIDKSMYEAGYVDGVRNRWQELYHITLPSMKPMLLFGAVMSITSAFNVCDVPRALAGYPSTDYAARTIVTHLFDYGFSRFEMGYASAIATVLFLVMILCTKFISAALEKVGT